MLQFSENLKKLRRSRDMTQDELACELMLSEKSISRYETGAAYPDIEMLPVMAGYFGVTVDELLGVSSAVQEKRKEEYREQLRQEKDHTARLNILRREHAEFPKDWRIVSEMVQEMTCIPGMLVEMRKTVADALSHCGEPLWRENIMFFYLEAEPDESKVLAFIEDYATKYDIRKPALLIRYYRRHGGGDCLCALEQRQFYDSLTKSIAALISRDGVGPEEAVENCRAALGLIDSLSGSLDREKPDMWASLRLKCLLSLSNHLFASGRREEGFASLEALVRLFEKLFSLPDRTTFTFGTPKLNRLTAKAYRDIYYTVTESADSIADSMVINLIYDHPLGPVREDGGPFRDIEGFKRSLIASSHTYTVLREAQWDGFASVKDDPRYRSLVKRAEAVSTFDNMNNLLYLMQKIAARTDDFIKDAEWFCTLSISGVGVYLLYGFPGKRGKQSLDEVIENMKRDGNTVVSRLAAVRFGGGLICPPEEILGAVCRLDEKNADAEVIVDITDNTVKMNKVKELVV